MADGAEVVFWAINPVASNGFSNPARFWKGLPKNYPMVSVGFGKNLRWRINLR
jgi:hypothetical protein